MGFWVEWMANYDLWYQGPSSISSYMCLSAIKSFGLIIWRKMHCYETRGHAAYCYNWCLVYAVLWVKLPRYQVIQCIETMDSSDAKYLIAYHSEKQCLLMLSQLGSAIVVKGAVCYAIMICMRFNIVHIDASILKHYFSGMQAPWFRHGGTDGKQHLSSIGQNFIDFRNMCIWRQRPWLH